MHCYIINVKVIGFMVSEHFLKIFPIITLRTLMTDPQSMAKLDPKDTVARFKTLLYTKYINYGPHRKDF